MNQKLFLPKEKKKAQMDILMLRYILVIIIIISIIIISYVSLYMIYEKNELIMYENFKLKITNDFEYMRQKYASSKIFKYEISKPIKICFLDIYQADYKDIKDNELIKNSLKDKQDFNIFFPKEITFSPFFIKDMHISQHPHYFCKEYKKGFFDVKIENINHKPYIIFSEDITKEDIIINATKEDKILKNKTDREIWCYIHDENLLPLVIYDGTCKENQKKGIDKRINKENHCYFYNFVYQGSCESNGFKDIGIEINSSQIEPKTKWCYVKPSPDYYKENLKKGTCSENYIFNGIDIKNSDYDKDGIPNFLDPDIDGDKIPNFLDEDIDGDDIPNWWEEKYGLDLYKDDSYEDSDGDGLTNLEEYNLLFSEWKKSTDPNNPDSDGDGWPDGVEVEKGYNPMDPNSHPRLNYIFIYLIIILLILIAIFSFLHYKKSKKKQQTN
jgi:hypothetical protein